MCGQYGGHSPHPEAAGNFTDGAVNQNPWRTAIRQLYEQGLGKPEKEETDESKGIRR